MLKAFVAGWLLLYTTAYIPSGYALLKHTIISLFVLFAAARRQSFPLPSKVISFAIAVFMVLASVSAFNSEILAAPLFGLQGSYNQGILQWLLLIALFLLPQDLGELYDAVTWGALAVALYGLMQALHLAGYPGLDFFWPFQSNTTRIYSTLGSPVFCAAFLAMAAPIALHKRSWTLLAILPAIFLTGSRGGMIAACVSLSVYFAREKKEALLIPILAIGVGAIIVGSSFARRDAGRFLCHDVAMKEIKRNPWLGRGPATFYFSIQELADMKAWRKVYEKNMQDHSHNDWTNMAAGHGIPAALIYIGVVLYIGYYAMGQWPIFCALLAVFITSKTNPTAFTLQALCAMLAAVVVPRRGFMPIRPVYWLAVFCFLMTAFILHNEMLAFYFAWSYNQFAAIGPSLLIGLRY